MEQNDQNQHFNFFLVCVSVCVSLKASSPFLFQLLLVLSYGPLCLCRYTTSPHLFGGEAEDAFSRVRDKVCPKFSRNNFCILNISLMVDIDVDAKDNFSRFLVKNIKTSLDVLFGAHGQKEITDFFSRKRQRFFLLSQRKWDAVYV